MPFNRRRVRYGIFRPCGRRVAESVNATRDQPGPRRCAAPANQGGVHSNKIDVGARNIAPVLRRKPSHEYE